jgi:hypothetical protein
MACRRRYLLHQPSFRTQLAIDFILGEYCRAEYFGDQLEVALRHEDLDLREAFEDFEN